MHALGRHHAGCVDVLGCWRPAAWATAVDLPLLVVGYLTTLRGARVEVGSPALTMWLVVAVSTTLLATSWAAGSRAATRTGWVTGGVSILVLAVGVVTVSW